MDIARLSPSKGPNGPSGSVTQNFLRRCRHAVSSLQLADVFIVEKVALKVCHEMQKMLVLSELL